MHYFIGPGIIHSFLDDGHVVDCEIFQCKEEGREGKVHHGGGFEGDVQGGPDMLVKEDLAGFLRDVVN